MNPWGAETILLETVDSTNTYAKALAQQGAAHGTVVLADRQTGGRGRRGRSFSSPAGQGIYCSVILRPNAPPNRLLHLTPMAAEAARQAVVQATGLEPEIKWINDLVLHGRKLCGILTELSGTAVILGIGINCGQKRGDFPLELQNIATSLAMEGSSVSRDAVTKCLLERLYAMSQDVETSFAPWLDSYRTHCLTLGREVQLLQNGQVRPAFVDAMDDHGALLVTLPDGTRETVFSGEVSVRGLYGYVE